MLIETGKLQAGSISEHIAVVTGAGRGIGFETARALAWLGATVVIAELDEDTGRRAAEVINREREAECSFFQQTDVGDDASVDSLRDFVLSHFGPADVVINNATITPMGSVIEVPIDRWDASYQVNLRGPVLLAKAFLPAMLERDSGTFICVSSVGLAYMGAYESFKAAQQHLAETLDAELEGTAVNAFTISPGLVRTPGALAGIEQLAPLYDMSVDEFLAMSEEHLLTAEQAGAGMAAAVALADQFRGQEISCKQALLAAAIHVGRSEERASNRRLTDQDFHKAREQVKSVRKTLKEQSEGWQDRSFFERQWMFRDFRKNAGMPVEQWLEYLEQLEQDLSEGNASSEMVGPLQKLAAYYGHMAELAKGYTSDKEELKEHLDILAGWQSEVDSLHKLLTTTD